MSVREAQRRALHDGLVEKLGADVADTLMDYLPPAGWSDLAHRSDLKALESRLDAKFAEIHAEFARIRTEIAGVRTEIAGVRTDISDVHGEVRGETANLRAWTSDKFTSQTRWFMASQIALVVAVIGSITTIAH